MSVRRRADCTPRQRLVAEKKDLNDRIRARTLKAETALHDVERFKRRLATVLAELEAMDRCEGSSVSSAGAAAM